MKLNWPLFPLEREQGGSGYGSVGLELGNEVEEADVTVDEDSVLTGGSHDPPLESRISILKSSLNPATSG